MVDSEDSDNIASTSSVNHLSLPQTTYHPKELVLYMVSKEELHLMEIVSRNGWLEAFWGLSGVGLAMVFDVIAAIRNSYFIDNPIPLDGLELLRIIVFSVATIGAVLALWRHSNKDDALEKLVADIKSRTKSTTTSTTKTSN